MENVTIKTGMVNYGIKRYTFENDSNITALDHSAEKRFDSFVYSAEDGDKNICYGADGNAVNSVMRAASTTREAETDAKRKILPYLLAGKMSGVYVSSTGSPSINSASDYTHWQTALNTIKGNHPRMNVNSSYVYAQTKNSYGYTNAGTSCATYALATAVSIRDNKKITPDQIATISSTNGHGTKWDLHDAYYIHEKDKDNILLGIDAQLQLGNPVLVHTYISDEKQHWATVIGKENDKYIIIDPWDGQTKFLSDMAYYKEGKLEDYVILSNKY